ncbi:MAG: chitobiase/beta-hexosaminidase C-terminal domain-containing protein [archaeon]|jgi:hypothetical protein
MKKSNNKNKKYLYIIIALLLVIIIGYLLISNIEVIGKASETVFTKGLSESSPDLKEAPLRPNLYIVATPTVNPNTNTYTSVQYVSLNVSTPGATARYTLDGSEPTESSAIYSEPLTINRSTTLKSKAYKPNWQSSLTATFDYIIIAETPIASQPSGVVNYQSQVSLSTTTSSATIRYTTNGTDPTTSSTVYSGPITINESLTLKAKAFKDNYDPSETATFIYAVNTVAIPVSSPPPGNVNYSQSVSLSTPTNGSIIKYTLDGSEPTENSLIYSNPFTITSTTVIKAKAYKAGYQPSATITFNFIPPTVSNPVSSPSDGNVSYGANVVLETVTPGAYLRYTLDGSEPNEESVIYNNTPFTINSNTIIKAKAFKLNNQPSAIVTFNYTVSTVSTPTANQSSGNVAYNSGVVLSTTTTGATIRFTLDGTEPTETSAIYSEPIIISESLTLKAKAYKTGYLSSSTGTFNYTVSTVSKVTVTPGGGIYPWGQIVTLNCETPGATIYYTKNGLYPTPSSSQYTDPITLTVQQTIKARAYKDGMLPSNIVSNLYFVNDDISYAKLNGQSNIAFYISNRSLKSWGCQGYIYIGAISDDNGSNNTNMIVNNCNDRPIAASICADLNYHGWSDWYLPAKNQIAAITNPDIYTIYNSTIYPGGPYWSSTSKVENHNYAYAFDTANHDHEPHAKNVALPFFCIRDA